MPKTTKNNSESKDLFQLKITLKYSKPPIWRRFVVDSSITTRELAHTIMINCDYVGNHLYEFALYKKNPTDTMVKSFAKNIDETPEFAREILKNNDGRLSIHSVKRDTVLPLNSLLKDIFNPEEDKLSFDYDLTSNINYVIEIEKVLSKDDFSSKLPFCLKAVGKAPSEYEDLGEADLDKINIILQNPEGYIGQYMNYEKEMNKELKGNKEEIDPEIMMVLIQASEFDKHGQQYINWDKMPKKFGGTLDDDLVISMADIL
jgi:hypothetical protein